MPPSRCLPTNRGKSDKFRHVGLKPCVSIISRAAPSRPVPVVTHHRDSSGHGPAAHDEAPGSVPAPFPPSPRLRGRAAAVFGFKRLQNTALPGRTGISQRCFYGAGTPRCHRQLMGKVMSTLQLISAPRHVSPAVSGTVAWSHNRSKPLQACGSSVPPLNTSLCERGPAVPHHRSTTTQAGSSPPVPLFVSVEGKELN